MNNLIESIKDATENDKLILIVGKPGSGKSKIITQYSTNTGIPIVDFSKILSSDTEDLKKTLADFLKSYRFDTILLDNKKELYQANNDSNLMEMLKFLSQEKKVITTWNGFIDDGQLSHIVGQQEVIYPIDGSYKYILV